MLLWVFDLTLHNYDCSIIVVYQTIQVSASVSALAAVSVAHLEGNLPSPDAIMQANLESTESEQDSSMSSLHYVFSAFADVR